MESLANIWSESAQRGRGELLIVISREAKEVQNKNWVERAIYRKEQDNVYFCQLQNIFVYELQIVFIIQITINNVNTSDRV